MGNQKTKQTRGDSAAPEDEKNALSRALDEFVAKIWAVDADALDESVLPTALVSSSPDPTVASVTMISKSWITGEPTSDFTLASEYMDSESEEDMVDGWENVLQAWPFKQSRIVQNMKQIMSSQVYHRQSNNNVMWRSTEHFYIFCQTTICTEKAMARNTLSLQPVTEIKRVPRITFLELTFIPEVHTSNHWILSI